MAEGFVRHKQASTSAEIRKVHRPAASGEAVTRSEELEQARAKADGLKIAKLR